MVRSLRIIHLPQTGDIHISIEQDGEHKFTPQVAFTGFLDPQLSAEMEWYFGRYLDDPFGPSKERAQTMEQGLNTARTIGLMAGLSVHAGGTTINRLCGSGLDAVGTAARAIKAGDAALMLAGESGRNVTGAVIVVDGGVVCRTFD